MSDFDISLGMNWLTIHRAPVVFIPVVSSLRDVTLVGSGKLTNVKRQVASLKSKVDGLEQKIDTLKNDLIDTKSQRDADLEDLSSCPLSPPVYKRMVII
nr:hypothetical protein [Tanacetum cinerariifolium]